jgi:hypothetical protein
MQHLDQFVTSEILKLRSVYDGSRLSGRSILVNSEAEMLLFTGAFQARWMC